jgi:hypothetical protein
MKLSESEMELFPRAFLDKAARDEVFSKGEKAAGRYRQYEAYILGLAAVSNRISTVEAVMRRNPGWTKAEAELDIRAAQTELGELLAAY